MTTTTAAPTKADPYADLTASEQRFEQRLEQARQERARLGQQERDYATKLRTAAAEYETLAANSDQFDAEGQPLKGSKAAKLRVVLEGGKTSRLPSMVAAADRRVEQVEAEWRAFRAANAPALARREWDRGIEAVAQVRSLAREMLAAVSQAQHGYHVLHSLVADLPGGALDGRSIQVDPQLDELERLLSSLGTLTPPRVPALVPYHDEDDPDAYLLEDNNWIRSRSVHQTDVPVADPQPARVERPA